jgi:3-phosphoshikimate 1-carboxyvinyltransferase
MSASWVKILAPEGAVLKGEVCLPSSKSISNRALIIQAMQAGVEIEGLSDAADTVVLKRLLQKGGLVYDVGPAGTSFRFLTAYLAFKPGSQILTGSVRMFQRPIAPLVDALKQLGADIEYLGEEGYPPLKINTPQNCDNIGWIEINAGVSSQFISALLLIGPNLPNGLKLKLAGPVVSDSYIDMTCALMSYFGVKVQREADRIQVEAGSYKARKLRVEADWSAASYFYAMAALAADVDLKLLNLSEKSLQGDAITVTLMQHFGIISVEDEYGLNLRRERVLLKPFEYNFNSCPDLAQTFAVLCAAAGIKATLKGLETLKIKETDRGLALVEVLSQFGIDFVRDTASLSLTGSFHPNSAYSIPSYDDHRMAMAFAALALVQGQVTIQNPTVVDKSFPKFWEQLDLLGFRLTFSETV